jgi:hypothetical protein
VDAARAGLEPEPFTAAWEAGRRLAPVQVLREAREP